MNDDHELRRVTCKHCGKQFPVRSLRVDHERECCGSGRLRP